MVPVEALLGLVLLMVGFVFWCNGMTLLGKTGAKEVGVLNLAVGIIISIAAWKLHSLQLTSATALVSIFALIYFMVAGIFILGYDAKGLGWFCLFACVAFIWYAYFFFGLGAAGMWFGIFCLAWALLVLLAFVALSLGKPIATTVAWLFLIEAILTLLIPGMLLLTDKWNPLGGTPGA
ncbi:MAG TPA: AmiS/UreI family transporter [Thermodesulfobacteriota bacterium]|nr:AmiS/UreI family transporter [Thermodesulfobacteriota bacterium]